MADEARVFEPTLFGTQISSGIAHYQVDAKTGGELSVTEPMPSEVLGSEEPLVWFSGNRYDEDEESKAGLTMYLPLSEVNKLYEWLGSFDGVGDE